MLYQIIIAAVLVIFLVNLILNLKSLKRPDVKSEVPPDAPLISVLVPARNEEANIDICLESLQRQDYPNYEILVLDDNSDDRTAEMVARRAESDSRVRLIRGEPLPDGWAGKPFACYQLAKKAAGSWFLFVDADTIHEPQMLRSILDLAIKSRASMLSGFPRQLASSMLLKIVMPVQYFIILGWLPVWLLQRLGKPSLSIGQFLLFNADEYRRMGGHEVVKDKIVEDVWLGIEVGRHKGRHVAVDLSPVVSSNMYRDIGDAWHGFGKSIYAIVAMAPLGIAALVIAAYFFYLAPFWWLWNGFFMAESSILWRGVVVFQVLVILFMRWLADSRFREPAGSFIFQPLGLLFYVLNVLHSGARWLVGAGVSWKERVYGGESAVK